MPFCPTAIPFQKFPHLGIAVVNAPWHTLLAQIRPPRPFPDSQSRSSTCTVVYIPRLEGGLGRQLSLLLVAHACDCVVCGAGMSASLCPPESVRIYCVSVNLTYFPTIYPCPGAFQLYKGADALTRGLLLACMLDIWVGRASGHRAETRLRPHNCTALLNCRSPSPTENRIDIWVALQQSSAKNPSKNLYVLPPTVSLARIWNSWSHGQALSFHTSLNSGWYMVYILFHRFKNRG